MSGAEAIAVLGLISSLISVIDGAKQVYDASRSARGLPEAFRDVANRLPIVTSILSTAGQHIKEGNASEDLCKGVKQVIEACQEKAKKLEDLFRKVIPDDNASRSERYLTAVTTLGKGNEVEKLMKGILEDVQLLAHEHSMKMASNIQLEQITTAVEEMAAIPPSVPNSGLQTSLTPSQSDNGSIHSDQRTYTPHLSARYETPPIPSFTVPFLRDPDYVNRQGLLEQVHAKCSIPASRTALVGLGGVGKSQLAIEYSYQVRDLSPETWVFWVHASNSARLEQSYRDIADRVKISGREDPKSDIFKLVQDWLCDGRDRKWCLILDNLDDDRFVSSVSNSHSSVLNRPLLAYLPQSRNGSILISTRSRDVATRFVGERDIVAVEPMDNEHAMMLLEKKLGDQGTSKFATELVAALDFMPLAIVQAAAYISQRAPRCSVQQYVEDFQKSDRKKTRLLNYEGGQLRRDWEAKNSVINTWEISFDYIRQIRRSAADLLSLMSFFDRQGIPETVVRNVKKEQSHRGSQVDNTDSAKDSDEDSEPESIEDDGFEDDILMLRNYSLISVNTDKSTFEMHRLVQLATREWLRAHGELERWKQQFIKNLSAGFPPGRYENWYLCQSLFPHVRSALSQQPTEKQSLEEWAYLLDNAAWYAWNKGNIPEAETMSVQALRTMKRLFGKEHPKTVNSMAILATVYSIGGRWNEAKELRVQVVEIMKRTVGEDHPDTLTDMSNLASTYWHQGHWKESEELNIHVMEARKRVLGPEHLDTLMSVHNLATTYIDQGKLKEAEELLIHVLEARKRALGAEHPDTLTSLNNLASNYKRQGRSEEAEELLIQAMETRKRVLGIEHPATLVSLNNVAAMYMDQGRYKEAEELGLQAIEISKRVLGANHPDTLKCIANLTSVLRDQARWDEARELDVQLLESMKAVCGPEHPYTLTCMNHCALTLEGLGQAAEAIDQMEQCVELQTRVLGPDHGATITSSAVLTQWKVAMLNIDTPDAEK